MPIKFNQNKLDLANQVKPKRLKIKNLIKLFKQLKTHISRKNNRNKLNFKNN